MPLSRIGLTVSHLPTSCSFFLAALSPLGYRCLGHQGKDIAFGTDSIEFFLHQQKESELVNPLDIAFSASNRALVDEFFSAALTAGGRCQVEPALRQDEHPYYSATVLDFDDNRIKVMYRVSDTRAQTSDLGGSDMQRISKWQSDVACNTDEQASHHQMSEAPRVIVNNVTTTPAVEVYRVRQEMKGDGEISTRAIISTILGASAGAAIAYAMAKSESEKSPIPEPRRMVYRTIEAPPRRLTETNIVYERPPSVHSVAQATPILMRDMETPIPKLSIPASHVKTIESAQARSSHPGATPSATGSHPARTLAQTTGTKALASNLQPSVVSRNSREKSAHEIESIKAPPSHHSTDKRSAKNIQLPPSRASTLLTVATNREGTRNDTATLAQDDPAIMGTPNTTTIIVNRGKGADVSTGGTAVMQVARLSKQGTSPQVLEVRIGGFGGGWIGRIAVIRDSKMDLDIRMQNCKCIDTLEGGVIWMVSEKIAPSESGRGPQAHEITYHEDPVTPIDDAMDPSVQRLLNDKLYDKRKQGALDLEKAVRAASANREYDKIAKIVDQLCHDFAYAVHQPHARNGGLIGLAAASIALGSDDVARYLKAIVPPVLACFTDQDARVRYYACESMYNIAKVAKGEILLFFNDVFDALCKLAADSELSVKNGAELLDRLVKDIVSESAATYVSVLQAPEQQSQNADEEKGSDSSSLVLPTAFSLAKFIPLLQERIHVINPFTRTFLVSWVTLLDTIPDLELVYYLPAFLGGLFKFLSDPNRDVHVATQGALERFLNEIKRIARIKKGLAESRGGHNVDHAKSSDTSDSGSIKTERSMINEGSAIADESSVGLREGRDGQADGNWVPGQDVQVDHPKILEILVAFLDSSSEEEIQLTALRWIDSFFEICPENILAFVPRLLSQVLPAMASGADLVRQAANRVNNSLMDYIASLPDEHSPEETGPPPPARIPANALKEATAALNVKEPGSKGRRTSTPTPKSSLTTESEGEAKTEDRVTLPTPPRTASPSSPRTLTGLDYAAAVNALTLHFLNENEATRVAALAWLIMLHRRAPRKVLATNDGTFPALLKTLSDPAEAVVTRDLQLLSQISKNSEDGYFTSFMVNLLQLFATDRKLLETRGNLIIRQLCVSLSAERIYRTLADCLEKDEDVEFASIMVQNLNNNLITAPELADLRKRLRNLETKEGQIFFVALFRSWCHNAVATFSLCLLAQAYEQAYNLLQIFAELEMTVNMLIQIDKLVQLLESPVFT
ncbi:MAG: hypothetical protein Q9163_004523, partial [Psora crenata]